MRLKSRLASVAAVAVLTVAAGGVAQTAAAAPAAVDPVPDTTWGVNGRVYATVIVGSTVYVGGAFTAAVDQAGRTVPRGHLAAFDLATGNLLTGWSANADGDVRALDAVGSGLYVGGSFKTIGGVSRGRTAEVTQATGAVVTAFKANADYTVRALESDGTFLYLGGQFNHVNGVARSHLAKVSAATGALQSNFAPSPTNSSGPASVYALRLAPDNTTLYVGGAFSSLNTVPRNGVGALDASDGHVVGPAFSDVVHDVISVDVSADGTEVFTGNTPSGGTARANDTTTGKLLWKQHADGDIQAIRYNPADGNVYFGFHDGFNGVSSTKLLAADARTGALDPNFVPKFNQSSGVWAIDVAPGRVVAAGGPFSVVSGVKALNLAFF